MILTLYVTTYDGRNNTVFIKNSFAHILVLLSSRSIQLGRCDAASREALLDMLPEDELVKALPQLLGLLQHPDPQERAAALAVMQELEPEQLAEVSPQLLGSLEDGEEQVRCAASAVLAQLPIGTLAENITVLADMLKDPCPQVRCSAVRPLRCTFISWGNLCGNFPRGSVMRRLRRQ